MKQQKCRLPGSRTILAMASITFLLAGCSTSADAGFHSASAPQEEGNPAIIVDYERTENPSWVKLMYIQDGSIKTCTLDKTLKQEEIGSLLLSGEPVKTISAGKDSAALEASDFSGWENAAFHPMSEEERNLLNPICVPHQYLYHSLGENASFLPEEGLTSQQVKLYLNLFSYQLEENPGWLSPAETTGEGLRLYSGEGFLEAAQLYYPGLPDNALENLPMPDTEKDDLGRVFLWYSPQTGQVTAASAELGGVLPAPVVKSVRQEGNGLEFTLVDYSDKDVYEKTFICEKLDKGYAVKKLEIQKIAE